MIEAVSKKNRIVALDDHAVHRATLVYRITKYRSSESKKKKLIMGNMIAVSNIRWSTKYGIAQVGA